MKRPTMVVALLILTGNGSGFNFERLANAVKQAARPAALLRPVALCAHHFYVLHEPAEAVVKLGEQCRDMIRSYAGVPSTYMQQSGISAWPSNGNRKTFLCWSFTA